MHGAGGHDHSVRTDLQRVGSPADACFDTAGGAAIDHDTTHVATHDDACTLCGRILQVRDQRRLLRTATTSHATVATRIVLRAAPYIARQESMMPLQLLEAANQDLVPPRRSRMLGVDAEPARDRIEGACELVAFEVWQAVLSSPLMADRIGCPEAGRVIDHGPAADRKSTRLNSSHMSISYAVFCL